MSVLQNQSILSKVLVAAVAGALILAFVAHYSLRQQQDRELQMHLDDSFSMLTSEITSSIQLRSKWMETSLLFFQHAKNAGDFSLALRQGDRQQLYFLSESFYLDMQQNNHITHMYFLDQQRRVLMRMHQPDRFGDVVDRFTAVQAELLGVAASGVELGPLGTITLRVVSPWIVDGQRLGYLELGIELDDILKTIDHDSQFSVMLALHKKLLNKQHWQLGQEMLNRALDWDLLDQYVIAFPPAGNRAVAEVIGGLLNDSASPSGMVEIDGRSHGLRYEPFTDVTGQEVGQVVMLLDVSQKNRGLKSALYATMVLFFIIVVATMLLLYLIISRTEKARELAESKLKLASEAIANTVEGVIITDSHGVMIDVNAAFEKVTGYSREEALGNNPEMLKSGSHDEQFYVNMWNSINEKGQWKGRVVNRRKNGEIYPEHLSITAIYDEQGGVKNYIGVFSDVSKQEVLQQQLHQDQRMESLGTLVGGIAHEFNNILAGMTGNLYLAKDEVKQLPETLKKLQTVEKLLFDAAAMIKKLLAYARKGVTQKEKFAAQDFVQAVMDLCRSTVPEHIQLHYKPLHETLILEADKTQSQQIILILIDNAVDALQDVVNPEITVICSSFTADDAFHSRHEDVKGERFLRISVADNGCGISDENLENIFEPFYTTKEVGEGAGLGLPMVIGTVKTHGGAVEVESTPGQRTMFVIYYPLCEAEDPVRMQTFPDISGKGKSILLVDDDLIIIDTVSKILIKLGYRVFTATNGRKAFELYRQQHAEIDLVMLDVMMPELGGVDAARLMREINPAVKIIFATGYDASDTLQSRVDQSKEVLLHKPYSINQLSLALHNIQH